MLLRLPSTASNVDSLRQCADGINDWKAQLGRGLLPSAETPWPDDPVFREALLDALGDLDMARFTRQFPPVLDTLMKNILDILYVYEQQKVDEEGEDAEPPSMQNDGGGSSDNGEDGDPEDGDPDGDGSGGGAEGDDQEGEGGSSLPAVVAARRAATTATGTRRTSRTSRWGWTGRETRRTPRNKRRGEAAREKNKELVEKLMDDFREQWEPAVDKLDKAAKAFEGLDLDDLAEGPEGFDVTKGLWQQTVEGARLAAAQTRGAARVARSRAKPRAGRGRGPLRRAPRQRERRGMPVGLVRSPLEPEETNGLCRSDDISRMLPSEMALIANGSRSARLLHFARRTERTLLSYERVGWAEEPAVTTDGVEIRPSAECAPSSCAWTPPDR